MEVVETFFVEELLDSESKSRTDAEDSAESRRARTQMSFLAKELHRVTLLLQRICLGVGAAVDLESVGLHFAALALAHRFDELASHVDRRAGGDSLEIFLAEFVEVEDYLKVAYRRAVVKRYELYVFIAAAGADPTFDIHFGAYQRRIEDIAYLCSFHR